MAASVVEPWVKSISALNQLKAHGPKYYRADKYSTRKNELIGRAIAAQNQNFFDEARNNLKEAIKMDPDNALFYYLLADIERDSKNIDLAIKHIREGNQKPFVKLYISNYLMADRWLWPEFDRAIKLSRWIIHKYPENIYFLQTAADMCDKLILCQPPNAMRLYQAISFRELAAKKIGALAYKQGDYESVYRQACFLQRAKAIRIAIARASGRFRNSDSARAWILNRALKPDDKEAAAQSWLLYYEESAEIASKLIETYIAPKLGELDIEKKINRNNAIDYIRADGDMRYQIPAPYNRLQKKENINKSAASKNSMLSSPSD